MGNKSSHISLLLLLMFAFMVEGCSGIAEQGSLEPLSTPAPTNQARLPNIEATRQVGPTALPIRFTKKEYEQALSTWRSHAIVEYEMKVLYTAYVETAGMWTLRVRSSASGADIFDYVREPGYEAPEGGVGSHNQMPTEEAGIKYLKEQLVYLTIDYQFENISDMFSDRWPGLYGVIAEFNSEFGYPMHVEFIPGSTINHGYTWSVIDFRVLKQGVKK